jgi:hypothetical protein
LDTPSNATSSGKTKHLVAKLFGGAFATIIAPILVTFLVKYLETRNDPLPPPAAPARAATAPPTIATRSTTPQSPALNETPGIPSPSPKVSPGIPDAAGQSIDVLARVEPAMLAHHGKWIKVQGVLVSPSDNATASLELPVEAAPAYRLEMLVERKSGKLGFNIFLPIDGRTARLAFDAYQGKLSGLDGIDGRLISASGYPQAYRAKVFELDRPTTVVVDVTPTSVRTVCDDKTVVDWHGSALSFSLNKSDEAFNPIPGRLFLGSNRSEFHIIRLTYTPLDAAIITSSATSATPPAGSPSTPSNSRAFDR